jgi:23S rRNA (cytosine1962-C5)-methyltransferase
VVDDVAVDGYQLLDAGDGARLERFGAHLVDRPHAGALAPRRDPGAWRAADLRFDRDGGWTGPGVAGARPGWGIRVAGVDLRLRPTSAGQVGFFPEHVGQLDWLRSQVDARTERRKDAAPSVEILNLFAHTGLHTTVLAQRGAHVTHVDSARSAVDWARQNAAANGLADHPIRWIVDDVRAYAAREARRGRRYDGVILDPPAYGHGGRQAWRLADHLPDLLATCTGLLHADGFLLLSAHSEGVRPGDLGTLLVRSLRSSTGPAPEVGDSTLVSAAGGTLEMGGYARWSGAS